MATLVVPDCHNHHPSQHTHLNPFVDLTLILLPKRSEILLRQSHPFRQRFPLILHIRAKHPGERLGEPKQGQVQLPLHQITIFYVRTLEINTRFEP